MEKTLKKHAGGRPLKLKKVVHRYSISFSAEEHEQFLALFARSGMKIKAHFILAVLFNRPIKAVYTDKNRSDYLIKLTELYTQFRHIGVNYNQIVKILYRNFSEKKAAAYLSKLEKETVKLVALCEEIIALTKRFDTEFTANNPFKKEHLWLQK